MSWAKEIKNGLRVYMAKQFPPGVEEFPERLFVSWPLMRLLQAEDPVDLHFDGEHLTFMGIALTPYEAEEPEYYIAQERGEFYEF